MSKIACDIDNTLYSFEQAAREEYLRLASERGDKSLFRGAYNPWTEWRSMSDVCGIEACVDVIEMVHSPRVIRSRTPYDEAVDVLWELADLGHELTYISNRKPEAYEATENWLKGWSFPFTERGGLICNLNDKIGQVSQCQYVIDDRPKTLVQFVHDFTWRYSRPSEERLGFGLAFPFNQALTDIPRVYLAPTWSGIRYYLIDKGVIT